MDKFFEFYQNNSGGYLDIDENVANIVIIEAANEREAQEIFYPMIENQSGSCPCCGDRWSPEYTYQIDLFKYLDIEDYAQQEANNCLLKSNMAYAIIHYKDGRRVEVFAKN